MKKEDSKQLISKMVENDIKTPTSHEVLAKEMIRPLLSSTLERLALKLRKTQKEKSEI